MRLGQEQIRSIAESTGRLNIWDGPVRTGKTVASVVRWLRYIDKEAPRGGDLYMIGRTFAAMKRNVISLMEAYVGTDCRVLPGSNQIRLWNRNIHIIGAHDAKAELIIRGSTSAGTYGDEITTWPESAFKMALTRLSLTGAKFFGTTNPDNPRHYLKREYLDRSAELGLKRFTWSLDRNPFLSRAYIDALRREFSGLFFKRFVLGVWCAAEGAIYPQFDEGIHVKLAFDVQPDEYIIGIDVGTSVPTCFLLIGIKYQHNGRPHAWVEREYYHDPTRTMQQKTDGQHAADLMEFMRLRDHNVPIVALYCDPAAASFRAECSAAGIGGLKDIETADNEVSAGISTVSTMLHQGRLLVHGRCAELLAEIMSYVWDAKRQLAGEDAPKKEGDHAVDALRYGLHTHLGDVTGARALISAWAHAVGR